MRTRQILRAFILATALFGVSLPAYADCTPEDRIALGMLGVTHEAIDWRCDSGQYPFRHLPESFSSEGSQAQLIQDERQTPQPDRGEQSSAYEAQVATVCFAEVVTCYLEQSITVGSRCTCHFKNGIFPGLAPGVAR